MSFFFADQLQLPPVKGNQPFVPVTFQEAKTRLGSIASLRHLADIRIRRIDYQHAAEWRHRICRTAVQFTHWKTVGPPPQPTAGENDEKRSKSTKSPLILMIIIIIIIERKEYGGVLSKTARTPNSFESACVGAPDQKLSDTAETIVQDSF